MYDLLYTIDAAAFFLLLGMLVVVCRQKSSKAQLAFILFDVFVMVFILGLHLELIHSDTVQAALNGLAVQYFGQCGFLVALLWFAQEFINLKVSRQVYIGQTIVNTVVMIGVMTAEWHRLFYTSMVIETGGMYNRISCTDGIIWWLHYVHFFLVFTVVIVCCLKKYHKSNQIQKKRIKYIVTGLGVMMIELVMKVCGIFGSYNPVSIALTFTMFCMMMALVKYGYFASLDAAMDNALNHGKEGLLIMDAADIIVFYNQRAKVLLPAIEKGDMLEEHAEIMDVLKMDHHTCRLREDIWELRLEDIIEDGQKTGSMLYLINLTEYVRHVEEARNANDAKTQFLMKISHELRTPMNVIVGMNELVLNEAGNDTVKKYSQMIGTAAQSMMSMIEEIIHVSQIERGNIVIKEKSFSLKKLLEEVEDVFYKSAGEKGLIFKTRWDGTGTGVHQDLQLYADEQKLNQILTNLLNNAVKYTESGSVTLDVKTDAQEEQNGEIQYGIRYMIKDTGIGIPKEEQEAVFERFIRSSQVISGKQDGLGLGLAIVREYVTAMGGKITLSSEIGNGSNFTVWMPYGNTERKDGLDDSTEQEDTWEVFNGNGKKILVVDDCRQNIMVLQYILQDTGVAITAAESGAEAVRLCSDEQYDLLLIDYMMPGMDGIEALQEIRRKGTKNIDTKAIMLSANAVEGAGELYLEAGFSNYLLKPVLPKKLRKMVRKYLFFENI